jgi:DNA-binding CsgD family transcriptional regulator
MTLEDRGISNRDAVASLLAEDDRFGRITRIADKLGISKVSVSKIMKTLPAELTELKALSKEQITARYEANIRAKTGVSPKVNRRKKDLKTHLVQHARTRAKKLGLEFDLVPSDIVVPEFCPVLGVKIKQYTGSGSGPREDSPSLDRIDNDRGYTWDNVIIVCGRANRLKNDSSRDERRKLFEFYESFTGSAVRNEMVQPAHRGDRKLTKEQEEEAIGLWVSKELSNAEICDKFGICRSTLNQIVRGRPTRIFGRKRSLGLSDPTE